MCKKFLINTLGITQKNDPKLTDTGLSPVDNRGKHDNRKSRLNLQIGLLLTCQLQTMTPTRVYLLQNLTFDFFPKKDQCN